MTQVSLSISELCKLADWVEAKNLKPNQSVTIESIATGIGCVLIAKVKTSEDEGIFYDLTNYDTW